MARGARRAASATGPAMTPPIPGCPCSPSTPRSTWARRASTEELPRYNDQARAAGGAPRSPGASAPGMYREGNWVMGMYSGQASPHRDQPTHPLPAVRRADRLLGGPRSPHPARARLGSSRWPRARSGRVGVPIDCLGDMVELLNGVSLDKVTPDPHHGQLHRAAGRGPVRRRGRGPRLLAESFKVMLQNDVLKEYVARHTHIFPYRAGRDFSVDVIEYCATALPHWEPIEFCGYHIRDCGIHGRAGGGHRHHATGSSTSSVRSSAGSASSRSPTRCTCSCRRDWTSSKRWRSSGRPDASGPTSWSSRFGATDDASRALNIFCYTLGGYQTASEAPEQPRPDLLSGAGRGARRRPDPGLVLVRRGARASRARRRPTWACGPSRSWPCETGVTRYGGPAGRLVLGRGADRPARRARSGRTWPASKERAGPSGRSSPGSWRPRSTSRPLPSAAPHRQWRAPVVGRQPHVMAAPPTLVRTRAPARRDMAEIEEAQVESLARLRADRDAGAATDALDAGTGAARSQTNTIPPHHCRPCGRTPRSGEICQALADVWGRFDANHS